MTTAVDARATGACDDKRPSLSAFAGVSALALATAATAMVWHVAAMSAMGGVPMPGGWLLSPLWTPMCGGTWPRSAASFFGMWTAMMTAMMLPAALPALWRYHATVAAGAQRRAALTALAGTGYVAVWSALGLLVFPLGASAAALLLHWPAMARAVPLLAGAMVLAAAALQCTGWKARHLRHCRAAAPAGVPSSHGAGAWRYGVRLGAHCTLSCAGLTASLLALGVMDAGAMAAVTVAVAVERLSCAAEACARGIGVVLGGIGACLVVSALYAR